MRSGKFKMFLYMFVPMIIIGLAQWKVRSAFKKYSNIPAARRMSGAQVAQSLLNENGIHDVEVEEVDGDLSDHYDPKDRKVRLSTKNYRGGHLAGLAIAAHEVGHAIQDATGYFPLHIRTQVLPVASLGDKLGFPLIFAGLFFGASGLLNWGILFFSAAVLFQIVTLPVEFNASSRAMTLLAKGGYLGPEEVPGARKVLNAAAMTYVAATAASLMTLLHYILLARGGDE